MPTVIPTNLTVIAQAVEQKLLAFTSAVTIAAGVSPTTTVVGDISNIYWVFPGEEPPPGNTGQRDVLLALHKDTLVNIEGDGRFAKVHSGMDVYLRSSYASDRYGTRKDWMISHRLMVDAVMDALMGFFPEDTSHNALTIEGFVLDDNAAPAKNRDSETWGETVGTYRFHYQPNITTSVIG